jgi:molybdopterin-guanine dinucleotide biosynthesis protein A
MALNYLIYAMNAYARARSTQPIAVSDALVTIPVVILAGGLGVRIGGNIASRTLAGKSLPERSLEKAGTYSPQFAFSINKLNELDLPDGTALFSDDAELILAMIPATS